MSHRLVVELVTTALLGAAAVWAWIIVLRLQAPRGALRRFKRRRPRDD